jgi:hypothetical protein
MGGPSSHIDLPLFSRYFTCIDMVIFLVAMLTFSAARAQFSLIVARFRRTMFFWGLVLATEVAFVVVMRVVAALFVVVVAIAAARLAIFRIITAILIGMPGFVAMNVAWFASKLRWRLPLGLVAFVFAVARRFVAAIAIAVVAISATA